MLSSKTKGSSISGIFRQKKSITTDLAGWTENTSRNISHFVPENYSHSFFFSTPKSVPIGAHYEIIFVVFSAPGFRTRRDEIRDTWAAEARKSGFPVIFFVGKSLSNGLEESLAIEQREKGDILRAEFRDSYANLTVKSAALLLYATSLNAKFIVKVHERSTSDKNMILTRFCT